MKVLTTASGLTTGVNLLLRPCQMSKKINYSDKNFRGHADINDVLIWTPRDSAQVRVLDG